MCVRQRLVPICKPRCCPQSSPKYTASMSYFNAQLICAMLYTIPDNTEDVTDAVTADVLKKANVATQF